MTKKKIVKKIAAEMQLSQKLVHDIVQRTFDEIIESLIRERRIELRNFGVFEVRVRAPRKARNPQTNERVDLPERAGVTFKPGKEMAERVGAIPVAKLSALSRKHLSGHPEATGGVAPRHEPRPGKTAPPS